MSQATTTRITEVGTVGIPVRDQERALTFYRDTLGFEVRMDAVLRRRPLDRAGAARRHDLDRPRPGDVAISPPASTPASG